MALILYPLTRANLHNKELNSVGLKEQPVSPPLQQ